MAGIPKLSIQPEFTRIEQAMRDAQGRIARLPPLRVNLATDAKGLDGLNKGLGKLSGSADEFTKSLEAANARVLAFGASVAVISALQRGFVNLVKSTVEVEAAFKKISVVGDQFAATSGQLEKFGRGIFDVARQTGQSFDETSKAALEFARQGLGAADTLVRVKDALTLTRLSGLDATSAVEGLTAAVNSFKKEGLSTTDILNKLIAVDNKYAVSSADLIEAIKRSGAFAQEAGVGFDELTATVTVLQEATARGGSVIGNSLKTIFERVGRPESIKQLQDLKVGIYDAQGAILPAIKIIDNFANKLNDMDEAAKRTALRQLAGTLQINQLSALTNALKEAEGASRRYDEVLSTSANASIEASIANNKLNETLDAQVKGLLATGTQLGSLFGNIGIAPALKTLVDEASYYGKAIVDNLSKDGPSISKAFASVIGDAIIAAGVAGTLSIGLILKKFAIFAKDSFSNILGINSAAKNQEAIQISILNTLRTRGDIEQELLAFGNNHVAQAQLLAKTYKDVADQEARRLAMSKGISGVLAPGYGVGVTGQPSPKGRRAAGGYVPDLVRAEYSDIKKGVGGANKNSGVVLINDFPFGGGKKGPMVANTSEGIMPMGNGAAVLNKDMLDRMGYGAAKGFSPHLTPDENAARIEFQKKRQEEIKRLQKEAADAQKASAQADKAAAKAAEKAAKAKEKAEKDASQEAERASKRRIAESKKAEAERQRAEKASQEASKKAAEAELRAAKAKEAELSKNFPVTAQLRRDQQLRASGKLLPPVGGGFGAFGKLSAEDIKAQNRQKILSRAGNTLSGGIYNQRPTYGSEDAYQRARAAAIQEAQDMISARNKAGNLTTGNIGFSRTFGGNPSLRQDVSSQAGSLLRGPSPMQGKFGTPSKEFLDSMRGLPEVIEKTKKTFSEASIEFGTQTVSIFLGTSVLKEGLTLLGLELNKTVDTVRDVAIAYIGIKKLGEVGGISTAGVSAFGGRVGAFARNSIPGGGRLAANIGPVIDGVKKFGVGLLGLLPAFGQFLIGVYAANSVLKAFGVDAYASIREFVTGLTVEGEKAKESLKTFSESLFDGGEFKGRNREDASRSLQTRVQQQQELIRAKNLGTSTDGKSPEQIAGENFIKDLEKSLGSIKVGGRKEVTEDRFISAGVGAATKITTGTGIFKDKFFSDLDNTTQQIILDSVGEIFALNIEELKLLAKQKGIKTTGGENRNQLASLVSKAAVEASRESGRLGLIGKDLSDFGTSGTSLFQSGIGNFVSPQRQSRQELKARDESLFAKPETVQAEVSAALELKKLQLDFATSAERILETRIKTAQISDIERANLQANLEELKLEKSLRGDIFDIASKGIDKLIGSDGVDLVKTEELKAGVQKIRELGLGVEETKGKIVEIFDALSGDLISDKTKKEILAQLDGVKGISAEKRNQLKTLNDQLKLETQISDQIRQQQSLLDLSFASRGSSIDSAKSKIEGRLGILSAQGNNPNLSTANQNSNRRSEIGLQIQSSLAERDRAALAKNEKEVKILKDASLNEETRAASLKLVSDEYNRTTQAIDDSISALKIQEGQIGATASAMTLLANAAFQFQQNLGEIESSNILSALRATDISSLGSSLSSQKAFSDLGSSGKTGLDAEQFLAERTALRQKEFEIASATSNVQKIQLTQEKKSLEDIIAIKERGGNVDEQIAALIDAQNKRLKEQRSLRSGVNNATAQMRDEISSFGADFGETATNGFKDALSEALKAAADGTGNLKNALLDVALSFANKLRDAALDNLAKIATNALFSGGSGESGGGNIVSSLVGAFFGGAQKKASGGKVTGGSGSKDDVPTLLMGGEYVVNKKSVQKYGPQFFEALNNGRVGGMASGGMFDPSMSGKGITGAANLKRFATQNSTSGATDKILSLGGGAAALELEPESLRLTNFARQSGNPLQTATQEVKDQAMALVFQDQDLQKQYREQLSALKKAEKEKQKQLLISLALAVVGAGVGGAFSGGQSSKLGSTSMTGGRSVGDRPLGVSGSSSSLSNRSVISSTSSASNLSAGTTRAISSGSLPSGSFDINSYNNPLFNTRRAAGGPVSGNGYGDNVPAMLSGGEFVMNRKAAKNMGLANLSAANSGQSIGMSEEKSEELNEKLLSKLDELVEKMSANNNVTVNVTMDKDGKATSSDDGKQNEDQKNMNRRIKDAVVQILQEEKRLGGVLRK